MVCVIRMGVTIASLGSGELIERFSRITFLAVFDFHTVLHRFTVCYRLGSGLSTSLRLEVP